MILGRTTSNAVKIKTDNGTTRAVNCACCAPVVCPCEGPVEGDNVFYLNARDGQDWISGGFRGNYNLSYSLFQKDGDVQCNSSGVNPSGGNWGGCGLRGGIGAYSTDFCEGGPSSEERTSFFSVAFNLCQVNSKTYALFCSIEARCNLRRVFPGYVYCDPEGFFSPNIFPDNGTICGALTIILPSGTTKTVNIFGYTPYDPTASATLELAFV
jgi:hypothetical protein